MFNRLDPTSRGIHWESVWRLRWRKEWWSNRRYVRCLWAQNWLTIPPTHRSDRSIFVEVIVLINLADVGWEVNSEGCGFSALYRRTLKYFEALVFIFCTRFLQFNLFFICKSRLNWKRKYDHELQSNVVLSKRELKMLLVDNVTKCHTTQRRP